ncbi:MAG: acyl carrier protein [Methylococcales bacterium]|jgi:acyl carrier protein|nr:acyl carrier protein [Methylococcales bacterium]MBT7408418.1 acyl carrier protein [Methylococcales bacterium]
MALDRTQLETEIKEMIISSVNLEDMSSDDIETSAPLFGEGLGLDSIDALEIGIALQRKYGVKVASDDEKNKQYFYSIETLANLIEEQNNG